MMVKNKEAIVDKSKKEFTENVTIQPAALKKKRFKAFLKTKKGRVLTFGITILIVIILLFAVPFTRYSILGFAVKKDVRVVVTDSVTNKPVIDAKVTLADKRAITDRAGRAKIGSVPVGKYELKISKQYYRESTRAYTVPILSDVPKADTTIVATGRQVEIKVIDKISKLPVKEAVLSVNDTTAATNELGIANIVLPAGKKEFKGTLSKQGFNTVGVDIIANTSAGKKNEFNLISAGSLFYLSKSTGVINVMKANLDGTEAKVIVPGTGQENDNSTVLLSARDWKYSVLLARRENNKERLYLVDSTKGDLTLIDQDNATFSLVGWSGRNFIYVVNRTTDRFWDNGRQIIKSYNTDSKVTKTIDRTIGEGTNQYDYQYESIGDVYIFDGEIVYTKQWNYGSAWLLKITEKTISLVSASSATGAKHVVKQFRQDYTETIDTKLYEPQGLYLRLYRHADNSTSYHEYENKTVKTINSINDDKFYGFYPTFLVSPSSKKTFWYEPRDGKNTVFIGDKNGLNGSQIATVSEYTPYGWYGDNDSYILFSKNGSELYIAAADKVIGKDGYQPLKVTDYHKPRISYPSYGYGYGGQ